MPYGEPDNYDNVIDSRDVIARIEYLADADNRTDDTDTEDIERELCELRKLAKQGESLEDWEYGVTLVRDSYFEAYAQELAEDIGATSRDWSWPNNCIDWEKAARELQVDYTDLEFNGVTYWAR